jgi:hypothetical protein
MLDRLPKFAWINRFRKIDPLLTQYDQEGKKVKQSDEEVGFYDANVVSSEQFKDVHIPLIDIDMEAALIPSSTPGHSHLYINKPMNIQTLVKLLEAMQEAGIVQKGFVDGTRERGYACLRLPHVKKEFHTGGPVGPDLTADPLPW